MTCSRQINKQLLFFLKNIEIQLQKSVVVVKLVSDFQTWIIFEFDGVGIDVVFPKS